MASPSHDHTPTDLQQYKVSHNHQADISSVTVGKVASKVSGNNSPLMCIKPQWIVSLANTHLLYLLDFFTCGLQCIYWIICCNLYYKCLGQFVQRINYKRIIICLDSKMPDFTKSSMPALHSLPSKNSSSSFYRLFCSMISCIAFT